MMPDPDRLTALVEALAAQKPRATRGPFWLAPLRVALRITGFRATGSGQAELAVQPRVTDRPKLKLKPRPKPAAPATPVAREAAPGAKRRAFMGVVRHELDQGREDLRRQYRKASRALRRWREQMGRTLRSAQDRTRKRLKRIRRALFHPRGLVRTSASAWRRR